MTTRSLFTARIVWIVSCLTIVAFSQDPIKTAPQAYQLQFENEWVKVLRVHYGPHEKIPMHDHSRLPAAYIYLNDSGPIVFRHAGWDHPELSRPAAKAGSFRLSPTTSIKETHEVENPTDIPSDSLRVEFKTRPTNRKSLQGRFYREDYPKDENLNKVQFENEQIRVTRVVCAPHKSLDVTAVSAEPALLIVLSPARLKTSGSGEKQSSLELGQTIWMAGGRPERFENAGDAPIEFLKIDLRTAPLDSKVPDSKGGSSKSGDRGTVK